VTVFDNETGLPEYDRLAAGAADVMVDALTALGGTEIGVIGNAASVRQPRSARDPRAIRRETGAGYLVIGQVQKDDGGIRMVTHLIRLDDETHLWVTRVVRSPEALAGIEAVSAARLADAVRQHVIEKRPDAPRFTR
jgi:TolB-like protein